MTRKRWNFSLVTGLLLLTILVAMMIAPSLVDVSPAHTVAPTRQTESGLRWAPYEPGTHAHPLGSDPVGRDLLLRILLGIRLTLVLAVGIMLIRLLVAIPLGLIVGWVGGLADRISTMISSGLGSVPSLILLLVLLAATEVLPLPEPYGLLGLLVVIGIPRLIEQVKKVTHHLKDSPHVEAAISLGATPGRIINRHIWRIMRGDIAVTVAYEMAWILILMAQMAMFDRYLLTDVAVVQTQGSPVVAEGRPELATMLAVNAKHVRVHWWPATFPAVALGMTVFCFHLLAEGLRQH